MELHTARKYQLLKAYDGHKPGTKIIFTHRTKDGKFNIFSPDGEPDMQSMMAFGMSETDDFVGDVLCTPPKLAERLKGQFNLTYRCRVNLEGTINNLYQLGVSIEDAEGIFVDIYENVEFTDPPIGKLPDAENFYFSIGQTDQDDDEIFCVITPKKLWDEKGYWDDTSMSAKFENDLPIHRAMDSVFYLEDTPEIVRDKMLEAGFIENEELIDV